MITGGQTSEAPARQDGTPPAPSDPVSADSETGRPQLLLEGALGLITACLSLAAAVFGLQFWDASPRVPLGYGGDGLALVAQIQAVADTGWWFHNERLGAPFGLEHFDFPFGGESLQIAMIRLMTFITDDPALVMNLYFLATFAFVGAAAYAAFRLLRVGRSVAMTVGVLYAILPFHFWHGTPHLYRSGYFAAPIACVALLWLLGYDGGLAETTGRSWMAGVRLRWPRVLIAIAAGVMVGVTDTVAAPFPAVLGPCVAIGVLVTRRNILMALAPLIFAAICAGSVIAANVPSLVYQARNGPNAETVQREPSEQEVYGLTAARLVTPIPEHRVGVLAEIGSRVTDESRITSEGGQQLGAIGAIGLIGGVGVLLGSAIIRPASRRRNNTDDRAISLIMGSSGLALVAIAIAVPSGFAFLASVAGFEEIRTWNRIVIYIAFFSLAIVAMGLRAARPALERRGRWVWPLALIAVALVGVLDQTPRSGPDYGALDASWEVDRAFFQQVENILPTGADVFSLPVLPYPEPSRAFGIDYGHMRGVIHTDDLRFSYGAIKGRQGRWLDELQRLPMEVVIDGIAASDFAALHVDAWGYPAGDPGVVDVLGNGADVVGQRDSVWLLDRRREDLEQRIGPAAVADLAQETLHPVFVGYRSGFHAQEAISLDRHAESEAQIRLTNDTSMQSEVTLQMEVVTADGPYAVTLDGGTEMVFPVQDGVAVIDVPLDLLPGETDVALSTDGPPFQSRLDPRNVHMTVRNLRVLGPETLNLVDSLDPAEARRRITP